MNIQPTADRVPYRSEARSIYSRKLRRTYERFVNLPSDYGTSPSASRRSFRSFLRQASYLALAVSSSFASANSPTLAGTQVTDEAALVSLADDFEHLFDRTAHMQQAERVATFRHEMNALLPGFYEPRWRTEAQYGDHIARSLEEFPKLRDKFDITTREFAAAYPRALDHFRSAFPGFKQRLPVYLLHSFGEMDGGLNVLRGRTVMIFGADVMARIHSASTIGAFLDHELFHAHHSAYFAFDQCKEVWCRLWFEGLAIYVAEKLNPGATDDALTLDSPQPLRALVDSHWRDAICSVHSKFESVDRDDSFALFAPIQSKGAQFPGRYGYYVGYRIAKEAAKSRDVTALTKMPKDEVHAMLVPILGEMTRSAGGCAAGSSGEDIAGAG